MPYSNHKFEMNVQFAGIYQNTMKRDVSSSKLFVFLGACTLVMSVLSISFFSHSTDLNQKREPYILSKPERMSLPPVTLTHKTDTKTKKTQNLNQLSKNHLNTLLQKQTDHFFLKEKPFAKTLAHQVKPPQLLPAIPSIDLDRLFENKKFVSTSTESTSNDLTVVEFKIKKSLQNDTKQVGLSHYLTQELTRAFSEKLDIKKVRPGDRFTILYKPKQGKKVQAKILAAKYISQNKVIKVVRLSEGLHKGAFFPLDKLQESNPPKSTVSLMRKPVKSGRVSSPFQPKRFHPILKRYKPHLGVDYAAAPGSPIFASGNGKVTFVGYRQGYGNLVMIQHDSKYSTRYGHMSRFAKIKSGTVVKQGQVIGYVGRTGYATGHHVHYEIRIHGKAYNPLTVALPNTRKAPALSTQRRQEIVSKASLLFAKMDELNKNSKNS